MSRDRRAGRDGATYVDAHTFQARGRVAVRPSVPAGQPSMARAAGYSTNELRAAAVALAAGRFADGPPGRDRSASRWRPQGLLVRVVAANAGAGASTVALALADVAAETGSVRLIDAASPIWSGLAGATCTELGHHDGWRRGRRTPQLMIDRLEGHAPTPADVPSPADCDPVTLTVLDVGWSARELDAHPGGWLTTTRADLEVVVTRVGAAAFGQTETILERIGLGTCALVVVGAQRWAGPEFAAAGPRMRQLSQSESISFVAPLRARRRAPRGHGPLPRTFEAAAQRLLTLLPDPPSYTASTQAGDLGGPFQLCGEPS